MFMFGASAFLAATSLVAKALGIGGNGFEGLNPFQVSAGRFVFGLAALLVFLSVKPDAGFNFSGAPWHWHAARTICGWLAATCKFAAVAAMPVAEVTAISFLSPMLTVALAVVLLGERIGVRKVLATALAVIGAALILRPGTDALQTAGLYALAAAGFLGLESTFIKALSVREPALRILVINNAMGAVIASVVAAFIWAWPAPSQWFLMIALGVIMVAGQAMSVQAMKRAAASEVVPVFYSVLIFAGVYDYLLYGVRPDFLAVGGSALIISAAFLLASRRAGA